MRTIYTIFREVVNMQGDKTSLMYKYGSTFEAVSYKSLNDSINCFEDQLHALGVKKGDKVAIISSNRPEWVITDLATIKLGAVLVPVYETLSGQEIKYILNDAEVKVLVAEGEYLEKVRKIKHAVPTLSEIIVINKDHLMPDEELFACSTTRHEKAQDKAASIENELASIVYTSGTTGKPKGVMLSQENIITNAFSLIERGQVTEQDIFLSFLPLSHMYERTVGYYVPLFAGATIAYVQNIKTIAQDMLEIRPTIMNVVPRLLEKMYEKIWDTVNQSPILEQELFRAALHNKNAYRELHDNAQRVPPVLKLKCKLSDVLVGRKMRKKVGGRLRFFTSGGASLKREIGYFFDNFGLKILEGYGLTETSPVLTSNSQDARKIGSVGKPLPHVKIRINETESEVLAKSPGLMLGYYGNEQATAEAIDADGWFHTGDVGFLDDDGYLWITGRVKELIVTTYGQKISPNYIEEQLLSSRFIDQVMVYGDGEKYLSALIVLNKDQLKKHFSLQDPVNWQEMLNSEPVSRFIGSEIEKHSVNFARYERIKQFVLLEEAFSVTNGLLTPTLKIKRRAVLKWYNEKFMNGKNANKVNSD